MELARKESERGEGRIKGSAGLAKATGPSLKCAARRALQEDLYFVCAVPNKRAERQHWQVKRGSKWTLIEWTTAPLWLLRAALRTASGDRQSHSSASACNMEGVNRCKEQSARGRRRRADRQRAGSLRSRLQNDKVAKQNDGTLLHLRAVSEKAPSQGAVREKALSAGAVSGTALFQRAVFGKTVF